MMKKPRLFLMLTANLAVLLGVYIAWAQPVPCVVDGFVRYDSGLDADSDTNCTIYNESSEQIGGAYCNGSGYYIDTVALYSTSDIMTVNCTDGLYSGENSGNCTGGSAQINVTLIVSEYPHRGVLPGLFAPVLTSASICMIYIESGKKRIREVENHDG